MRNPAYDAVDPEALALFLVWIRTGGTIMIHPNSLLRLKEFVTAHHPEIDWDSMVVVSDVEELGCGAGPAKLIRRRS